MGHEWRVHRPADGELDPRGADEAIEGLASVQRGVVARWQLRVVGLSDEQVDGRIGALLLPRHRGVYLVGHRALAPGAAEQAALLAVPGAALAGRCAATWLEVVSGRAPVELVTGPSGSTTQPGLVLHRCASLRPQDVELVDGLRCTTVARTACDLAAWHPRHLRRFLNEAERQLRHTGDLRAQIRGRRGARAMHDALDHLAPQLADLRSVPEEALAEALLRRRPRLPVPHANVLVHGHLVDLHWPDHDLVVQIDGAQDHLRASVFDRDRRADNDLGGRGIRVRRYPATRIARELRAVVEEIAGALVSS